MYRQGYGYSKSWVHKRMTLSQVSLTCSGRSLAAYRSIEIGCIDKVMVTVKAGFASA